MRRIRLLILAATGLLIVLAATAADARVRQRYQGIYRSHVATLNRTGNLLGQLAQRGEAIARGRLEDIQSKPMGKWLEQDRWYTNARADRKVVACGLAWYRDEVGPFTVPLTRPVACRSPGSSAMPSKR